MLSSRPSLRAPSPAEAAAGSACAPSSPGAGSAAASASRASSSRSRLAASATCASDSSGSRDGPTSHDDWSVGWITSRTRATKIRVFIRTMFTTSRLRVGACAWPCGWGTACTGAPNGAASVGASGSAVRPR